MDTCATVASIQSDGTIKAIHIQVNGNDLGVGFALTTHYATQELVDELIAVGNVGMLSEEPIPNTVHFMNQGKLRELVSHDYSVDFRMSRNFANQEEWFDYFDHCDYGYFFDGSEWTFYKNILVD
jgi:hypothetical protein